MLNPGNKIAVFGGGCFWCTEAAFKNLKGVVSVLPGYAGGDDENPTYEKVCSGKTGHAEVIEIEYNPEKISYDNLLTVFFAVHDSTTLNRQGNDIGTQYRSIILYADEGQKNEAEVFIAKLNQGDGGRVVTELKPLEKFYEAEDYHRNYFEKNPDKAYCQMVINPKLEKLQEKFSELVLSPELLRVARGKGTEAPFAGKYVETHEKGMYKCAVCGNELFSSDTKFDSGTGWPSFTDPVNLENIELRQDLSFGDARTEVVCKKCGAHLGHVFNDGPAEKGGKRYCINSVCLDLEKSKAKN